MKTLLLAAFLVVVVGCGGPDGTTWLIKMSGMEITVSEAGDSWNELPLQTRQMFMAGDNPVGDFITTLSRKTIIVQELSNEDYLYSPLIQAMRNAWLRSASYNSFRDSLSSRVNQSVTDQDIDNYRALLGKIVWYSLPDGSSMGPTRLPDLEWNIAFAFDTMNSGDTVEILGEMFILDSVVTSPDSLIQVTLSDSARMNSFARSSLTESRTGAVLDSLKNYVLETLYLDSLQIQNYSSSGSGSLNDAVIAEWEGGRFTAADLDGITALLSLGGQVAPSSVPWIEHNLKNHVFLALLEDNFSQRYPESYAEMLMGADAFALQQASDLLFEQRIVSAIQLSDSMVLEEFQSMDSLPVIPETRTFYSVVFTVEAFDEVTAVVNSGGDPMELGYAGYTPFLESGSEFLSRPVLPSELPSDMGVVLFMAEENDTEWLRAVEISENLFVLIRLGSVIPAHEADFQEIEGLIRSNLRAHLKEQQTVEWLCELEQKYDLEINSDILSDLPPDPAAWSEL